MMWMHFVTTSVGVEEHLMAKLNLNQHFRQLLYMLKYVTAFNSKYNLLL